MLRRKGRSEQLELARRTSGVVVRGSAASVERFIDRATELVESEGALNAVQMFSTITEAVDVVQSQSSGVRASLVELSPRAMELLREHGAIPTDDGYFRSMVHDGKNFAGNLDWKPVTSPTDLAQLQSTAVTLALQASLKNLADAVARVERQVGVVSDLIRSEQFGDVLGQHRVLQRLLDMTADGSKLSSTDWHSIDQMRVDITSSLERTRMFIRSRIDAANSGWLTRSRAEAAEDLIESGLVDTLGVLSVCEQNLAGWHHLRLLRVQATEPEQLDHVVRDIEGDLALHRADDEALASRLVELLDELVDSTGFEGFEPWQRRSLSKSVGELREATERFVTDRRLDVEISGHGELPGAVESARNARDRAVGASRRVFGSAKRRLGREESTDDVPEIEAGAD